MNKILLPKKTSGKVAVPNGELYFESYGVGDPIILSHAGFSDRRDWQHQIEDFSREFRTIVYDQRGCGNSTVISSEFSPGNDIKAIMDHLQITKATLIGHCIGGTIVSDFVLQYPERVSNLILLAPGLNGYTWPKEYLDWMLAIWHTPTPKEMTKASLAVSFYAIAMSNPIIKTEIEKITEESFEKVLQWKTFDLRKVQWFFPDAIPLLKKIKIPAFFIYGDQDSQDIKQIAQILKENLSSIKIYEMKDVDHLLNFEKPTELNNLVLNFLKVQQLS